MLTWLGNLDDWLLPSFRRRQLSQPIRGEAVSENRYDIYVTGKLLDGSTPAKASAQLATLFKISAAKAQALLDGRPHRIKQGADRDTAKRLLQALKSAGVEGGAKQQTQAAASGGAEGSSLRLAPEGTPVLRDDERPQIEAIEVNIDHLELQPASAASPAPPPPAAVPAPDYGLAPAGSQLEQLPDSREPLNPDVSHLSLAEAGTQLLEENKTPPPAAPNVDHLQLKD